MNYGDPPRMNSAPKREADWQSEKPFTKRPFLPRPPVEELLERTARRDTSEHTNWRSSSRVAVPREYLPLQLTAHGETNTAPLRQLVPGRQSPTDVRVDEPPTVAEEKRNLSNYTIMLETALKSREGGRDQVARLEALFRPQLHLNRAEVDMLRKRNADLEDEKTMFQRHVTELNKNIHQLEAEISSLSLDIREQKRLYEQLKQDNAPARPTPNTDLDTMTRANNKLKRAAKKHEKRLQTTTAERDALRTTLDSQTTLLTQTQTALHDESFRFKILQSENTSAHRHASALQNQIAQLRRDITALKARAPSTSQPPKQSRSAPAQPRNMVAAPAPALTSSSPLDTHVVAKLGGMFTHYRALHAKNEALWDKLWGMAKTGGFGNHGSLYRRELEELRGLAVEELEEWKSVNRG
ncbi:hypothetical protein BDU57DRAFT_525355 [Ampelomyces quisqualis]|uniref:Uncharacterized protein n=1 Tax=Ampelomyces quisqualis TaxID=50730 RepID=A0A6A5QWS0_AMPQU|nr:hypothetical protein BDU57DRAFT_525355 [Ampelomyces quisqualis]